MTLPDGARRRSRGSSQRHCCCSYPRGHLLRLLTPRVVKATSKASVRRAPTAPHADERCGGGRAQAVGTRYALSAGASYGRGACNGEVGGAAEAAAKATASTRAAASAREAESGSRRGAAPAVLAVAAADQGWRHQVRRQQGRPASSLATMVRAAPADGTAQQRRSSRAAMGSPPTLELLRHPPRRPAWRRRRASTTGARGGGRSAVGEAGEGWLGG